MSVIIIVGGGGAGGGGNQNRTVSEAPDGSAVIEDADGTVVAKFSTIADAIAYLQHLNASQIA